MATRKLKPVACILFFLGSTNTETGEVLLGNRTDSAALDPGLQGRDWGGGGKGCEGEIPG